jgi:DNA mismatch repair ATPase MutL
MIYEKCRDILLRESEMVQNATILQEKIRLAVTEKDWTVFEDHLSTMNGIEYQMEILENERENLFTVFEAILHQKNFCENLDAKGRFYKLVSILPENQRNELTSIYRSLKIEAIKLRMANDTLMIYLEGIKATLKDFFYLAFPERSGKMYTIQGTHLSHVMKSMVLNTRF